MGTMTSVTYPEPTVDRIQRALKRCTCPQASRMGYCGPHSLQRAAPIPKQTHVTHDMNTTATPICTYNTRKSQPQLPQLLVMHMMHMNRSYTGHIALLCWPTSIQHAIMHA